MENGRPLMKIVDVKPSLELSNNCYRRGFRKYIVLSSTFQNRRYTSGTSKSSDSSSESDSSSSDSDKWRWTLEYSTSSDSGSSSPESKELDSKKTTSKTESTADRAPTPLPKESENMKKVSERSSSFSGSPSPVPSRSSSRRSSYKPEPTTRRDPSPVRSRTGSTASSYNRRSTTSRAPSPVPQKLVSGKRGFLNDDRSPTPSIGRPSIKKSVDDVEKKSFLDGLDTANNEAPPTVLPPIKTSNSNYRRSSGTNRRIRPFVGGNAKSPPNTNGKSPPKCIIRFTGDCYQKDFELTLDKKVDEAIYRILKCIEDECIEFNGLHIKERRSPLGLYLMDCFAPIMYLFSKRPPGNQNNSCGCHPGCKINYCSPTDCRKPGLQSCCVQSSRNEIDTVKLCSSRSSQMKVMNERGVGTDTFPELESLLRDDNLQCRAKMKGLKCKCRKCCVRKKRCKHKRDHVHKPKYNSNAHQSGFSDYIRNSVAMRKSTRSRSARSEHAYSLLLHYNQNSMWDTDCASSYLSDDSHEFSASSVDRHLSRKHVKKRKPLTAVHIRSEPLDFYSSLHCRLNRQKDLYSNIVDRLVKNYFIELHNTSKNIVKTVNVENSDEQMFCVSDHLEVNEFQTLGVSRMNSTVAINIQSVDPSQECKPVNPNDQINGADRGIVLNNAYSPHIFVRNFGSHQSIELNGDPSPPSPIHPETSRPFFKRLLRPSKKRTNLAYSKRISSRKHPINVNHECETPEQPENATHQCGSRFGKFRMHLKKVRKIKSKTFQEITLNKKDGMLDLSSILREKS